MASSSLSLLPSMRRPTSSSSSSRRLIPPLLALLSPSFETSQPSSRHWRHSSFPVLFAVPSTPVAKSDDGVTKLLEGVEVFNVEGRVIPILDLGRDTMAVVGFARHFGLQAQSSLASSAASAGVVKYGGPMDVAKHVLRHEGGTRGLFKGLVPTLGREVPGNALMFGAYEATKQFIAGGRDTSKLGRGSLMASGAMAGIAFWCIIYPADVVKSVIQVDDYKNPKYSGSIDALRKIRAAEGIKGLYKGFGPAMIRSVPANGACFLAYEVTRSALG